MISKFDAEKITHYRYDSLLEGKHEGPYSYVDDLKSITLDFINVDGHNVILPVDKTHHANIEILRSHISQDGQQLAVYLKDTTHIKDPVLSGWFAYCERVSEEEFFVATLYHEWYAIEQSCP